MIDLMSLNKANQDLPEVVMTKHGAKFNPRLDNWIYRERMEDISIDFGNLQAERCLINASKKILIWYAENKSCSHVRNMFYYFKHFLKTISLNQNIVSNIKGNDIINYRSKLMLKNEYYLGNLSGFLKKWHSLGVYGVSDDAITLLKKLRIKGNRKGEAVLTMDPLDGPFTDLEVDAIIVAVESGYKTGNIKLEEYLLIWLFLALGQRPIQYASLKVCDFKISVAKDGTAMYLLNVPRAKQQDQLSRSLFSQRKLAPKIGEKFIEYIEEIKIRFAGKLSNTSVTPLFPAKSSRKNEPNGYEYHRTSESLSLHLKYVLNRFSVISERTEEPLHITATRFRRTLGTRAAMEGHGELVIAELLDHNNIANVGVYVQATPEIVQRIDRAMAFHLAPLAQAFSGVIIKSESEAIRKDDPTSRICDPHFEPSMKPMGNCGQHGFCGELAPISCYTCRNFQPWLDGPHEAVLNHLISERERLIVATDSRIASINDRTILAVAEVVRRCKEIKSGESEASIG